MQRHGEFLARRAHGGRSPEVHHQPARLVALVLQMPAHQFFGQLHALAHRRRATAPRGGRWCRGCAPWAAHRPARDRANPRGPAPPAARPARRAAPPVRPARWPRPPASRRRDAPEDVQPVAELAFLHVADEAVDPGDRLGRRCCRVEPKVGLHPRRRRLGPDVGHQAVAAARGRARRRWRIRRASPSSRGSRSGVPPSRRAGAHGRASPPRCAAWPARPRRDR